MGSLSDQEWVVQVTKCLKQPLRSDRYHDIYGRVPKSLQDENTEIFYIPRVITFGPHHFSHKSPLLDEIEVLKSEAAQKYDSLNGGLKAVVENFKSGDTLGKIRKIYGKEVPGVIGEDVLSWMMVRDGCFLIEILKGFSEVKDEESNGREGQDNTTTPLIDRILDRRRYHPLLNDIEKDMFKMENQLPLLVLHKIVGEQSAGYLVESALKNMSPIEVNVEEDNIKYKEEHHILQLLHDYMVDKVANVRKEDNQENVDNEDNVDMEKSHWMRRRRKPCASLLSVMNRILRVVGYALIILVLSPVLISIFAWFVMAVIWEMFQECLTDEAGREESHIRTLEELRRSGVKFKTLEGRGISHIKFEESTLYLPKFNIDDRSEVLLRNLMALEIYSNDVEKPITRYALLMNDLVNTSADVAILRKYNIITSKLGSYDDVAKLWNSIMMATQMPTCDPIDKAASSINGYCKNRWKVLWAQFKMLHCSKPWLVLSLLGGTSLLLLTMVQVACLFRDCQIRKVNS